MPSRMPKMLGSSLRELDATPTNAQAWALLQAGRMRPMVHLDDLEGCLKMLREAQARFVETRRRRSGC